MTKLYKKVSWEDWKKQYPGKHYHEVYPDEPKGVDAYILVPVEDEWVSMEPQWIDRKESIELCQKAMDKWGKETQINKIQEEALELALILNQRNCPTKDQAEMEDRLYDELADMTIMMAQAKRLFDGKRINERVKFKLVKLEEKYFLPQPPSQTNKPE